MKPMTRFTVATVSATLLAWAVTGCGSGPGGATAGAKPYPLDVCLVSGEKLDGHGKPYAFVHEGQEIKLCCKECLKDFQKEPAKYLAKLAGPNPAPEGAATTGHGH